MPKIIGLIGETGSGKDTVCQFIKEKYPSALIMRFSDPIREALAVFLDEKRKEDQQWFGIIMRERFGEEIIFRALERKIQQTKEGIAVFNGVRFWGDYNGIKKLSGKIIYVTADSKIRWQRVKSRKEKQDDNVSYKKFLEMEKSATEILVPKMGQKADFKAENNGTIEEFHNKIQEILNKII